VTAATRSASFELTDPDPTGIAEARRWAAATASAWDLDHLADALRLVVSELVANAFEHAGTGCTVRLDHQEGCLRVEVHDGSAITPVVKAPGVEAVNGRGLTIVRAFATAFGTARSGPGKVVWCELADDGSGRMPAPA
jgi:anti-sigma regulatory factor (Ser/Thr protein kinase)